MRVRATEHIALTHQPYIESVVYMYGMCADMRYLIVTTHFEVS